MCCADDDGREGDLERMSVGLERVREMREERVVKQWQVKVVVVMVVLPG